MKQKNPLRKLELVIATLGAFMILGLVLSVPSSITGRSSWYGFGAPEVCAQVPSETLMVHGARGEGITGAHVTDLAQGARAHPSEFDLCARDPTMRQRVLATLIDLPRLLFFLGFLLITWRLTRRGRRRGLFTADVARAVERLSVYLFFGQFVVAFIQAWATQHLVATLLSDPEENDWLRYVQLGWVVIIAAFGLQAMARVVAATVPMQAEIDATV